MEDTILSLNSPKALEILQLCHMLVWGILAVRRQPPALFHFFIYFFFSLCTEFNLGSRIQHFQVGKNFVEEDILGKPCHVN